MRDDEIGRVYECKLIVVEMNRTVGSTMKEFCICPKAQFLIESFWIPWISRPLSDSTQRQVKTHELELQQMKIRTRADHMEDSTECSFFSYLKK